MFWRDVTNQKSKIYVLQCLCHHGWCCFQTHFSDFIIWNQIRYVAKGFSTRPILPRSPKLTFLWLHQKNFKGAILRGGPCAMPYVIRSVAHVPFNHDWILPAQVMAGSKDFISSIDVSYLPFYHRIFLPRFIPVYTRSSSIMINSSHIYKHVIDIISVGLAGIVGFR